MLILTSIGKDTDGSIYLTIKKKVGALTDFTHGIKTTFNDITPKHMRFKFSTSTFESESANIRLMDSETLNAAISFRAGYNGFVRINADQIVYTYNDSISTFNEDGSVKKINWIEVSLLTFSSKFTLFQGRHYP